MCTMRNAVASTINLLRGGNLQLIMRTDAAFLERKAEGRQPLRVAALP